MCVHLYKHVFAILCVCMAVQLGIVRTLFLYPSVPCTAPGVSGCLVITDKQHLCSGTLLQQGKCSAPGRLWAGSWKRISQKYRFGNDILPFGFDSLIITPILNFSSACLRKTLEALVFSWRMGNASGRWRLVRQ